MNTLPTDPVKSPPLILRSPPPTLSISSSPEPIISIEPETRTSPAKSTRPPFAPTWMSSASPPTSIVSATVSKTDAIAASVFMSPSFTLMSPVKTASACVKTPASTDVKEPEPWIRLIAPAISPRISCRLEAETSSADLAED